MNYFQKVLNSLIVVIFGGITIVTIFQVFFRYVLNAPLMWSEEFARYLFVWGVLLATGIGLGKGSHIGVEIIFDRLPAPMRKNIRLFSSLLIIFFSLFLTFYGIQLVGKVMKTQSPALHIPMGFVYAAVPACSLIWVIFSVQKFLSDLRTGINDCHQEG
jgi:TRAP-type C4-dicarboxylate transport system permease small subunit